MPLTLRTLLAALVLTVSAPARADVSVPPPPAPSPPYAIGAGLTGVIGSWRYTHGDSAGSTGTLFAGLAIEPRYRVVPELTLGVLGVAATALGSEGVGGSDGTATYERRVYRAAAVARLWPWPDPSPLPGPGLSPSLAFEAQSWGTKRRTVTEPRNVRLYACGA